MGEGSAEGEGWVGGWVGEGAAQGEGEAERWMKEKHKGSYVCGWGEEEGARCEEGATSTSTSTSTGGTRRAVANKRVCFFDTCLHLQPRQRGVCGGQRENPGFSEFERLGVVFF